jgi:hypothetical protein
VSAPDAVCPKCNGTAREVLEESSRKYRIATYRESDHTIACRNCGGQTMSLTATGRTRVDPATGLGCMHEYIGAQAGNCYRVYACRKCGDGYDIDSGD